VVVVWEPFGLIERTLQISQEFLAQFNVFMIHNIFIGTAF
jgi:hypothetical protein